MLFSKLLQTTWGSILVFSDILKAITWIRIFDYSSFKRKEDDQCMARGMREADIGSI